MENTELLNDARIIADALINRPKRYKKPYQTKALAEDVSLHMDCCVPDQALSVRELLQRAIRESKPLPKQVDYDIDALVEEYKDLSVPEHLSKEDALHLMSITKAHMGELEFKIKLAQNLESEKQTEKPSESDS